LEDDPENKEANQTIAESYRLSNRIEEATPYYQKLVETDPTLRVITDWIEPKGKWQE